MGERHQQAARSGRRAGGGPAARAGVGPVVCASALGLLLASAPWASAQSDPAYGYWLVESKRAVVRIEACDGSPDRACGEIVWLAEPLDSVGQPRLDVNNPEPALKSRQLCGLAMIGDFVRAKRGVWEDGFIYDPTEGETYSAWMEVQKDGALKVRGYIGVSLLGRSQIWTRAENDRGGC